MTEQTEPESDLRSDTQGEKLGPLHYALFAVGILAAGVANVQLREELSYSLTSGLLAGRPHAAGPMIVVMIVGMFLDAASVAAIPLAIIRWRQRSGTFPAQFGHWLLLFQGAMVLMVGLTSSPFWRELLPGMRDPDSEFFATHWRIHILLTWLVCIALPCLAVYYSKGEDLWRFYAAALILTMTWTAWLNAFPGNESDPQMRAAQGMKVWLNAATMLAFLVAAVRDIFWKSRDKDLFHWIGILVAVALGAVMRLPQFLPF